MDESKIIAKIGTGDDGAGTVKEPIFVTLSEFKNFRYVDIRKFYQDNGEWKPTKKGITMHINQIDEFIDVIQKNRAEIESWFKK